MLTFPDIAFGDNVPLYSAQDADSSLPDVVYIYFRTQIEEPKDPTFAEARPALVEAWKLDQAYQLALKDAEALADKSKKAESLKSAVSDPTKLIETPPFSWMSTGSMAFGFGEPGLSAVPGIDLAGNDFMREVFTMSPGQTGVAPNHPHTTAYVVRVKSQTPDDKVLREQFLESGLNMQVLSVAQQETFEIASDWMEQVEERFGLEWHRVPQPGNRG
jgi:hypothetical protein